MVIGALLACFGLRWGAGLAGGAGLALVGWAGLAIVMQLPEDPAGPVESAPPPAAPASDEPDAYRDAPTGRDRREVSLESRAAAGEAQAEPEKPPLGAVMPASALDGSSATTACSMARPARPICW